MPRPLEGSPLLPVRIFPHTHTYVIRTQVTLTSSFLGEESNVAGLTTVVGSLIAAQVSGKVVGESADEIPSDYFRLSTGVYDAATMGTIQVGPRNVPVG